MGLARRLPAAYGFGMHKRAALYVLALLLILLPGCGGGDDDEPHDDRTPRPGVDCKTRPELCR